MLEQRGRTLQPEHPERSTNIEGYLELMYEVVRHVNLRDWGSRRPGSESRSQERYARLEAIQSDPFASELLADTLDGLLPFLPNITQVAIRSRFRLNEPEATGLRPRQAVGAEVGVNGTRQWRESKAKKLIDDGVVRLADIFPWSVSTVRQGLARIKYSLVDSSAALTSGK